MNFNEISSEKIYNRAKMLSFYLNDPIDKPIERILDNIRMRYFYFNDELYLQINDSQILNGCLLSGAAELIYKEQKIDLNKFDFFFLSPNDNLIVKPKLNDKLECKICLFEYNLEKNFKINAPFEVQHFSLDKFIPRGEFGSKEKMCTYRTVWTAIKNGYFMSGFTNIPNESLKQGVITSVNLEKNSEGKTEVYPHVHPEFPEIYIMCIDDDKYAISQYMINLEGESVCRDLKDGEGLFFPGSLGHCNFARPFYKNLKYCMYMWIIPTFGRTDTVLPITLKV
ncbi:MAG: hypothetical protein ACTSQP_07225 [Promethearchaeota archaeon]